MEGYMMKVRLDKKLHLMAGMLVVSVTFPFVNLWSMVICFIVAVGKELFDKQTGRVCEGMDAYFTLVGGMIMLAFFILGGNSIGI